MVSSSSFAPPTEGYSDRLRRDALLAERLSLRYTQNNDPNADILLESLRSSGYTLETAVGDLVDNSVDANADEILVTVAKYEDEWVLSVADSGVGMDRETLDQMMRLGSRTPHDLATDLGAFGLGSTTASLSLGRHQHVVTRDATGISLSGATDLDACIDARAFVKHLDEATPDEIRLFSEAFAACGLEEPATGTFVLVSRCDRIERSTLKPAVDSIRRYLGQTYRHFIGLGKRFYLNGELVPLIDPLMRDNPETRALYEETFDYSFPKGHPRHGEVESITAIIVELPNFGDAEANKGHGITTERSGFYILRNGREIVPAQTFGFYSRHPALSRFRGELQFPATMDQDLGVSFLKSVFSIKPSQSLRDKLRDELMPYVIQARRFYYKSQRTSDVQVPHDEAAKVITQRAPLLRKPKTITEDRQTSTRSTTGEAEQHRKPERSRFPRNRMKDALAERAVFVTKDLGPSGPIFEADLVQKKVVVTYNGQHPFYQHFILENQDNRGVIAGVDYLVYSLATAELRALEEEDARFVERMREDYSYNLRALLSTSLGGAADTQYGA